MRLYRENNKNCINPKDLKDGDIAIIIYWESHSEYRDEIVQRFDDHLITLGKPLGQSFHDYFTSNYVRSAESLVEVLEPGTKLVI